MSDQPTPLTVELAAHLFKLNCNPEQLADLQDGVDAFIAVLIAIDALDYYITRSTRNELEMIAAALHVITDEPMMPLIQLDDEYFKATVPVAPDVLPDDTRPASPNNDDLTWLDRILPTDV